MVDLTLGRLVEHDERSRLYQAPRATTPRSVLWGHHAPVLDQGTLSSCTGNAAAQLVNTDYFAHARPGGYLTEADAVKIYELATRLDAFANNTYPPNDEGSSGLGAAKAGVRMGYFSGYKHCFGFDHFTAALQLQPVIVGVPWYKGMFTPNAKGFVRPTGKSVGGHEFLALGVSFETSTLIFLNSWGASWGPMHGRFCLTFTDFAKLLSEQGDATVPLPKTVTAP